MHNTVTQFAQSHSGGISALGLNLKAFIFQLIAFLIVLIILSKFVFPRLVKTLEERRTTLEKSLEQARQTEQTLIAAQGKAAKLLHSARTQADAALADAKLAAKDIVSEAETAAEGQAERILKEARDTISDEHEKLHDRLRGELVELVAGATEKITGEKLDASKDAQLIEKTIKDLPE